MRIRLCPRCGAIAERLAYHNRYTVKSGHMATVIRCKQRKGTFCDRYYDLKSPVKRFERANHQGLEDSCPEAVAGIECANPTSVQRRAIVRRRFERARDKPRTKRPSSISQRHFLTVRVQVNGGLMTMRTEVRLRRRFHDKRNPIRFGTDTLQPQKLRVGKQRRNIYPFMNNKISCLRQKPERTVRGTKINPVASAMIELSAPSRFNRR